jgi:hypothetical protein
VIILTLIVVYIKFYIYIYNMKTILLIVASIVSLTSWVIYFEFNTSFTTPLAINIIWIVLYYMQFIKYINPVNNHFFLRYLFFEDRVKFWDKIERNYEQFQYICSLEKGEHVIYDNVECVVHSNSISRYKGMTFSKLFHKERRKLIPQEPHPWKRIEILLTNGTDYIYVEIENIFNINKKIFERKMKLQIIEKLKT